MPQDSPLLLETRSSRTESERRRLLLSCDEGSGDVLGYCRSILATWPCNLERGHSFQAAALHSSALISEAGNFVAFEGSEMN